MENVAIPDMVFLAPAEAVKSQNKEQTTSSSPNAADDAPARSIRKRPSSKDSNLMRRQQSLLWAFSKAPERESGGEGDGVTSGAPNPRVGVVSSVEGGGGRPTATAPPSVKTGGRSGKFGFGKENHSPPLQQPPVQQLLYTKFVDPKEGLLCAARAICDCGRRGGGGGGGGGGGTDNVGGDGGTTGSKLKLPLAMLKVWGRDSDEERGRRNYSSAHGKTESSCRGRRLKVVSRTRNSLTLETKY